MSTYKKTYSEEQAMNFVVPIILLMSLGVCYFLSRRSDDMGAVSFILIGVAAITMFYWNRRLKKMLKEKKPKYVMKEQETKKWVYDLFNDEKGFVFVAEVPGPENNIMVRLIDGVLYIRGSGGFSKEVVAPGTEDMEIIDFKYRNGVLTLKIQKPINS